MSLLLPLLESILLQVRGSEWARLSAKDPLPAVASREEVEATKDHTLETFYPISPTIDLQECHVYDMRNNTGEGRLAFRLQWHGNGGQELLRTPGHWAPLGSRCFVPLPRQGSHRSTAPFAFLPSERELALHSGQGWPEELRTKLFSFCSLVP